MDLVEALAGIESQANGQNSPVVPKAGSPSSYEWDGEKGTINTPPTTETVTTWDQYLIDSGLDPNEVEVIEPVQVRGWDSSVGEGNVVRMHYYRLTVRRKRSGPSLDALLDLIKRSPESDSKPFVAAGSTFVVALADCQLGKRDGDGVEGTYSRTVACLEQAAEQLKFLNQFTTIESVHLAWLGDMCEGFNSQGGANAWRTPLALTEQIQLLRKLMLFAIELFYPLAPKLTAAVVPGNHDEAVRFGKSGVTKYNDSFDVDALKAVEMACELAGRYENATFYFPDDDELTVTFETSNTVITHAHGHKFKSGNPFVWWKGQTFGGFPPGKADILLSGHVHHLQVEQSGPKTSVRVPSLEDESTWYRHQTGEAGYPGIVTLLVNNHELTSLSVLHGN